MSEQPQQERVQRPALQAKYRYLADFGSQDSPNLRKQYRQSSPHQLSNQRRSPSRNRSSHHSSHKRVSKIQRCSPSCSTFKPRREPTLQQFSPYDERKEKEQCQINSELWEQNTTLRSQLVQSKQLIQSLRAELTRREVEIVQVKESSQADLHYFEKVVSEMAGEIQIVLTKNKILENQLTVVKARLQDQVRRVQEYARFEEDRKRQERKKEQLSKFQEERRSIQQKRREDLARQEGRLSEQTNKIANQPPSRRSVGKLMTKTIATHHQNKNQSLQTSKIKIQDQYQSAGRQNYDHNVSRQPQKQKQNKKVDQLIQSILGMQMKIAGRQAGSLKELWKWLKEMGHSQSCLKRWKAKAQNGMYSNGQRLKELIKEACSYIQ